MEIKWKTTIMKMIIVEVLLGLLKYGLITVIEVKLE